MRNWAVNDERAHTYIHTYIHQWHCANIEYSTATDIHTLSVRNWAVDDEHAFDGVHCLLVQGYQSVAKSMAKGLDLRLESEVMCVCACVYVRVCMFMLCVFAGSRIADCCKSMHRLAY